MPAAKAIATEVAATDPENGTLSSFARAAKKLRTAANAKKMDAASLRAYLDALPANVESEEADFLKLAEWSQLDPAGAWQWMVSGGKRKFPSMGIESTIMGDWMKQDPTAAINALKVWKSKDPLAFALASYALKSALTALLANSDQPELTRHLDALIELGAQVEINPNGESIAEQSKSVLEKAAKYLQLPECKAKTMALASAAGALAVLDFNQATAWIATLPQAHQTEAKRQALLTVLHSTSHEIYLSAGSRGSVNSDSPLAENYAANTKQALSYAQQWFKTEASASDRTNLGAQIAKKLGELDPAAGLQWSYENLSGNGLSQSVGQIITAQAKSDLPGARNMVEALPPGRLQMTAATQLAKSWVQTDADTAIPWLLGLAKQSGGEASYYEVASKWSYTTPDKARAFIAQSPESLPKNFLTAAVNGMASKEPQATAQWAAALPDGPARETSLTTAISSWAQKAPAETGAWLLASANGSLPAKVFTDTTVQWFRQDAAAAVDWVSQLPAGQARTDVLAQMKTSLNSSSAKPEKVKEWQGKLGL